MEHDYLTDGFWAMNRSEELPTPGLKFRFVHRIVEMCIRDRALYVNIGIGYVGLPFRFGAWPEITVLKLVREKE